jgi:hypothetical protein
VEQQGTFATVASATGTEIGAVAEAAASISKQFDVTGLEEMRDVLAALTMQGKAGSFELSDAAAQFQKLAAAGAAFGLDKGAAGAKTLGGLTQIARSGTGSADEAATSVSAMFAAFDSKQKQLSDNGVDVFKGGKKRGVEDLLVESISKVGGNDAGKKAAGLRSIFGEQGIRAINPLINTYQTARDSTKGTEAEKTAAGVAALRDALQGAIHAPGTWADVVQDAAQAQRDSSAQLTGSWEKITQMAGAEIAPALAGLISTLAGSELVKTGMAVLGENMGALGDAVKIVTEILQDMNLLKKEKSLADQKKDADAKLTAFDKANDLDKAWREAEAMPEGPKRDAAIKAAESLEQQRSALTKQRDTIEAKQWTPAADVVAKTGRDEFMKKYAEAGGGGFFEQSKAGSIMEQYDKGERRNDWMIDETTDQKNLRQQYEGQLSYEETQRGTRRETGGEAVPQEQISMAEMKAEIAAVASAAREASAALKSVKAPPRIFPNN